MLTNSQKAEPCAPYFKLTTIDDSRILTEKAPAPSAFSDVFIPPTVVTVVSAAKPTIRNRAFTA